MRMRGDAFARKWFFPIFASTILLCGPVQAADPSPAHGERFEGREKAKGGVSMHQYEWTRHMGLLPADRVPPPLPKGGPKDKLVQKIVYGYYPYWVSDLAAIQWDLLTHIAYFAVSVTSTGQIGVRNGWPDSPSVTTLVQTAQANETKVHLTITLFSEAGIAELCGDAVYRATAIDNLVDEMEAGGADGLSIDFETPAAASRDGFTLFIAELRAELDARGHTDAEIAIAGTAWSGMSGFDLDALLDHADIYFIMGYPYFGSWSTRTGPVGKLRTSGAWASVSTLSAARTIGAYTAMVSAQKRRQIVYGVPYYGWQWTTSDDQPASAVSSSVGSVFYNEAMADLSSGQTRLWDNGVRNPYYCFDSGGWNQVWYDDAESLAEKYMLVLEHDLGGVGMWALNYDVGHTELWDLLADLLSSPLPVQTGDRFDPIRITSYPYYDQRDLSSAPSNYFDYYNCEPTLAEYGREWVYRLDLCQPGRVIASVPEYADVDPDLHLLTAADQDACLGRAHLDLDLHVDPGMYLLTVDTWVTNQDIQLEGPYELNVDFVPDQGTEGCAPHLVCEAGECLCAGYLTDCGTYCADLRVDPNNCGECDRRCEEGQECVEGSCIWTEVDAGAGDGGLSDAGTADSGLLPCCGCKDKGCSCRSSSAAAETNGLFPSILVLLSLLLFFLLSRTCRAPR